MFPTGVGLSNRINAETGKVFWSHEVSEYTGDAKSLIRNAPAIGPTQLIFGDQAIAATGAVLLWARMERQALTIMR